SGAGGSSEISEYSYDEFHQIVTMREPGVFIVNEYDSGGRVTRQIINEREEFRFAYQVEGQRIRETEVTRPDGFRYRVGFDAGGLPIATTYEPGTPQEARVEYEREPGTHRIVAMSIRCPGASRADVQRSTISPQEDRELAEARLWQSCGLSGTPVPGR